MTDHIQIEGIIPRIQYVADGVLTSYSFPFAIFDADNMKVYFNDALQQKTTYQVTFVPTKAGGTVNFNVPPPANTKITLVRDLSIERTSDFQEGGALRADTLNHELDYQIACQQQIADKLNRTLIYPVYAVDDDVDFTLPTPSAGKAIVWDSTGKKLETSTIAINALESTLNGYKGAAESAASTATTKASIASDKADMATTQAQIATEKAAEAESTLASKANKDMDNLSDAGKEKIVALGMPSTRYIDFAQSSGESYLAPANGYVYIKGTGGNTNYHVTIDIYTDATLTTLLYSISSGGMTNSNPSILCPVPKGCYVRHTHNSTIQYMRFIYALGST